MISHLVHRPWPLLVILISLLSTGTSWASELTQATAMTPRAKLERMLACQQADKEAALKEKAKIDSHLHDVRAFRETLSDNPKHRLALDKTERALEKDREALTKAEERLRLTILKIGMTERAVNYLPVSTTNQSPGLIENGKQRIADWLAQFSSENSAVIEKQLEGENGFINDPVLHQRLGALLDRVQDVSTATDVPATIRILDKPTGGDVFTTGTTIYFDKAYLDQLEKAAHTPKSLDDELLFTMGHELAHIQLHHVNLGFTEASWQRLQNAWQVQDVAGTHPDYARDDSRHSDAVLKTQLAEYQRNQEFQADLLGAQHALAAGLPPKAIKDKFTRMGFQDLKRRLHPDVAQQEPRYAKMLEDHARPDERLKALEAALGEKFWERTDLKFGSTCLL
jgi:Peptidase family M48